MDIFPSSATADLDDRSADQVREFARSYRQLGQGPITILVPTGARVGPPEGKAEAVRRTIKSVTPQATIMVATYPVGDPSLAAPIRLTYVGLKARVADECGQWPRDLASGGSIDGWDNKTYWNYGCSMQTAIAAEVADPRDLVTPHAEVPADTIMRSRGIESVRKGTDPATDWKVKNTAISSVGGGS
jgi:pilus assembly protein CpaD